MRIKAVNSWKKLILVPRHRKQLINDYYLSIKLFIIVAFN